MQPESRMNSSRRALDGEASGFLPLHAPANPDTGIATYLAMAHPLQNAREPELLRPYSPALNEAQPIDDEAAWAPLWHLLTTAGFLLAVYFVVAR